ncbi:baseplate hub protein [Synechococcus phage S-CAM4]|uniref:Baseplate hub protein n=1 Tax=Synechococcus phage S-CAM4 TaxID=1883367 RepID=A0A1D8KKP6_9CAUD|nr:baseplate hub protein [Synechococcus phage S-CAM4]
MDQLLSQLIPTQRIGSDGFNWWVGQVEQTAAEEKTNKGGYRFKVRIVGDHPASKEILDTPDLPWANVMMPVNVPFMPGNVGGAHPQLIKGCWVVGFYLDHLKQKPIIMGSIGQTPGATTISKSERPDGSTAFGTVNNTVDNPVNPVTDGQPAPENPEGGQGEANKTTGALPTGDDTVPIPPRMLKGRDDEKWCQSVAEKCDKQNLTDKTKILLGEFLNEVQKNDGNIGTYLISPISGTINSGVGIARKYVNKFMAVIRHFIAKVKGFVLEKLTNAVKDLIKAVLYPNETGNALTPVTEWFNNLLKDLGCKMADLGDRLAEWLTNVLMGLVNQVYRAAACQVDTLVNGILSKINSLMETILSSILGPIQDILGAIAGPLNILGGAINFVLKLLGISCSGPNNECAGYKQICTDGEKKDKEDKKGNDFLDDLLSNIDNLFPATGADFNQYTCEDAYTGKPLSITTVGFTGGVPRYSDKPTKSPKIVYTISDIVVEEGFDAVFQVTRTGVTESASSVSYRTSKKGTATPDKDYLPDNGILGFAPGETVKNITIRTFSSPENESDEDFYVILKKNSPGEGSRIRSTFIKNVGRCVITERNVKEPGTPYYPKPINPITELPDVFPPDVIEDIPTPPSDDTPPPSDDTSPSYEVVADKVSVNEGDFVQYTITTENVENGTYAYYTLTGDIDSSDIIGGATTGSFVVNNNTAEVIVGISEDSLDEEEELLIFTVNGTGATTDVLVVPLTEEISTEPPEDDGEGDTPDTTTDEFIVPEVIPETIITDDNGGIIEIPISQPGDPWAEPPYVFIGGEGIGAVATPLLDQDGFITEIRIKAPGYGYKLNLANESGVRCIIDAFTIIRPGIGYTSEPDMYINGELGVAEAVINEDGFVVGARILDRQLTFEKFPEIVIVGGGGYGAKLLPSFRCLDTEALTTVGSTKIGTGRYIDCP